MKVKEENEKLVKTQHSEKKDHGIQSHHFMANKWGNNENTERLYFFGLPTTADGDCSHEIKKRLLLGRKAMVFPVVMYGGESWIIKKAEHQIIDAFEL